MNELEKKYINIALDILKQKPTVTTKEVLTQVKSFDPLVTHWEVFLVLKSSSLLRYDTENFAFYLNNIDLQRPSKKGDLFVDFLLKSGSRLLFSNKNLTKKNLRKHLLENNVVFSEELEKKFQDFFSSLKDTGRYTSENHKIYAFLGIDEHYSETDQKVVKIKDMHPNYIYNLIKKRYGQLDLEDCFKRNSEIYQLLKAYFTYDIRARLKDIIND